MTTPALGVASATSVNKVAITAPSGSATLTLADGSTLATSGAHAITLTSSGATNVTLPLSGILVSAISVGVTHDFANIASLSSESLTNIVATGAADGDAVSLGVPHALASAGGVYSAWVSAPNLVTIKFSNTTGADIDPPSGTFKIKILK
jgi:hypothetical protein